MVDYCGLKNRDYLLNFNQAKWKNPAKTDFKDPKGTLSGWLQSASKSIIKGRLNIDLLKLRDMIKPDNKSSLKNREESFGELCDLWQKQGIVEVRFERWVGDENGPLNHLAFCFPSE